MSKACLFTYLIYKLKGRIIMNNFIFENSTKVYFGRNCVKEYLSHNVRNYKVVMLAYGGGSVKKNGIYGEIMDILKKEEKKRCRISRNNRQSHL